MSAAVRTSNTAIDINFDINFTHLYLLTNNMKFAKIPIFRTV